MNIHHVLALKRALDHLQSGRPVRTIEIAARVLEQDQENADAWFLSGVASQQAGQTIQALDHLDRACRLVPDSWDYLNHRATVLCGLGRFQEGRSDYERSLNLRHDHPETLANLARLHVLMQRHDLAQPLFRRALSLEPANPSLHGDLGVCLVALRCLDAGIASYRAGLALDPEDAEIHYNLSRALLMVGDYAGGWLENEWRWQTRHYRQVGKKFPYPLWLGEPLNGQTILLMQEQGFGDAIQMVRYAPLVARRGGKVVILCDRPLQELFAAISVVEQVLTLEDPLSKADCCCPMLSLPKIFETRLETIPLETPYLHPPPNMTLPGWNKPERHPAVGVVWRGKSRGQLTATAFKPLFQVQGIHFLSLQKDTLPGELGGLSLTDTQT
ncbi:MAG TPA: tetratricopeptide repeat protein, partial [Magnetococcales bacterium]|nr:tetratricopeptide repeat protein [Magnetococcales bacterium]